ncbi:arsinothricin resistance N-acetyltransferase ArsN1 family B [Pseudonocardia xishanensis]|uniref:GNAT family N-acetyltransferase n=1 Tax=Pseudonocardia xishanensis TaxID=630995 RepID=A0ABP8RPP8_9PSEU
MIRPATPADAAAVAAIYAPFVRDTTVSFETEPPDTAETARRIEHALSWLVAEVDGVVRGYAYAGPHRSRAAYRWSVDVSVYVDLPRSGLGRALYERLFAELTERGYAQAFAGITLPNEPSIGLHRALGFEPVGVYRNVGYKLGAWRDVSWWQRELRGATPDPGEAG